MKINKIIIRLFFLFTLTFPTLEGNSQTFDSRKYTSFRLTWFYINDYTISGKKYDEIRFFLLSFDLGLNAKYVFDKESNVYHYYWCDLGQGIWTT